MGKQPSSQQLLDENTRLRAEMDRLKSLRAASHEDRLKLAIIDRAPFTLWACDREFRIRLWCGKCEHIYGVSRAEALGKEYVDLFVALPEQEQSRRDCLDIIDNDLVQTNFLASDKDRMGGTKTMLTNCFRIWDDESQEWLQAEVAVEVSDSGVRQQEYRTLERYGWENLLRKAQEESRIEALQQELFRRLNGLHMEAHDRGKRLRAEIDDWGRRVQARIGDLPPEMEQRASNLDRDQERLEAEYKSLTARVFAQGLTIPDCERLHEDIDEFEQLAETLFRE